MFRAQPHRQIRRGQSLLRSDVSYTVQHSVGYRDGPALDPRLAM